MTYQQIHDGEWIQPVQKKHQTMCCDCGLVHTMDFRVKEGRVQFRAVRNKRATAAARRRKQKCELIEKPTS